MAESVAMSIARLQAYLRLERALLELEDLDDPFADRLRDAMDPLWYALTDEEHAMLDARGMMVTGDAPLKLIIGDSIFIVPDEPGPSLGITTLPPITGWEVEAA